MVDCYKLYDGWLYAASAYLYISSFNHIIKAADNFGFLLKVNSYSYSDPLF